MSEIAALTFNQLVIPLGIFIRLLKGRDRGFEIEIGKAQLKILN